MYVIQLYFNNDYAVQETNHYIDKRVCVSFRKREKCIHCTVSWRVKQNRSALVFTECTNMKGVINTMFSYTLFLVIQYICILHWSTYASCNSVQVLHCYAVVRIQRLSKQKQRILQKCHFLSSRLLN